jgi:UDP-N-acetylmuramoyl-L-alanyl-D-glutamate--2,6-diaminopimelate ligase
MTRTLADLGLTAQGGGQARVSGLSVDSRAVEPGHLFGALPGSTFHGGYYIEAAVLRGASAVLTDAEGARIAEGKLGNAILVLAEDPRQTFARTAALWFGPHPETVVAVTGTNGKTSVASFCRQIWMALDLSAVNLGTVGVEGSWEAPLRHTTPDPLTLHRVLAQAREAGVTHVAMEASSHGLDQRRLDGVWLAAAGFTNFTQDHLDYHGTFDAYFDAKMRLFRAVLPDDGVAVVNLDDPRGRRSRPSPPPAGRR